MDRIHYTPEDFCRDESYLNYYFRKDAGDVQSWEDWISRHPEKLDVIVAADQLIAMLSLRLPEEAFLREQERTLGQIQTSASDANRTGAEELGSRSGQSFKRKSRIRSINKYRWMAAVIVLAVLVTGALIKFKPGSKSTVAMEVIGTDSRQIVNSGKENQLVTLEDGSRVTLEKGARLTLPVHFLPGKREVWLEGNAFFDVSKNASRPFYIFSRNIVTHVIGTSFYIRQDPVNRRLEVSVVTGKVEVYEKQAHETAGSEKALTSNGVILIPNQKVVYGEDQQHFETSLTENPVPVERETADSTGDKKVVLTEHPISTPVSLFDMLAAIEKEYGISIAVENENLYNCHFSGDLSGLGLYEKIDVVCRSVGASYKIRGTQLLIRGNGCVQTK